jgi:hypothetical protein
MERLHPAMAHVVPEANGLDGAEAVLAVATLLGRVRELEGNGVGTETNGDVRETDSAGREANGAVLETLTRRGFDAALRRRLGELVEDAQRVERPRDVPMLTLGVETADADAPDAGLVALHAWYEDWAATARALVERKDWLIRLGLRERPRRRAAGGAGSKEDRRERQNELGTE